MTTESKQRERPSARTGDGDGTEPGGAGASTPKPSETLQGPQSVHQRMVAILSDLPAIGKDSQNVEQKFMFRSHDAVLNALNPLLARHGVYVVPDVLERLAEKRTTSRGSTMYEVNLHVRYTFVAEDGSWMQASAWGEGTDMGDKATNKAMTMAFKNVLAQAFAVSTAETQDADAGTPEETTAGDTSKAKQAEDADKARTQNRRDKIAEICIALDKQTGTAAGTWHKLVEQESLRAYGVEYGDLKSEELDEVGKTLKAKLDAKPTAVPEQLEFVVPF